MQTAIVTRSGFTIIVTVTDGDSVNDVTSGHSFPVLFTKVPWTGLMWTGHSLCSCH